MGEGINIAGVDNPDHSKLMEDFKDQLLIVLMKRLGGAVTIPLKEADDTGMDLLLMQFKDGSFTFRIDKKH